MKAIFVTVRTGSNRLPNKALLKINGKHTIEYVIDSVKKSTLADIVVLCTTNKQQDLILCEIARNNGISFFQGDEENKWKRWQGACKKFNIDFFVNADGDDLFYEAGLADTCFKQMLANKDKDVVIDGQGLYNDVYGISSDTLNSICSLKESESIEPHQLVDFLKDTHVAVQKIENVPSLYEKKDIRMTLDYPEDFIFFKTVIEHFGEQDYNLRQIYDFIEINPHIRKINYFLEEKWRENQSKKVEIR